MGHCTVQCAICGQYRRFRVGEDEGCSTACEAKLQEQAREELKTIDKLHEAGVSYRRIAEITGHTLYYVKNHCWHKEAHKEYDHRRAAGEPVVIAYRGAGRKPAVIVLLGEKAQKEK